MAEDVVVVTGGGRGIGRAVGELFANRGSRIVAAARSKAELAEVKAAIEKRGGTCHVAATDVTVSEQVDALFQETCDRFGRIDVLVNCAGMAPLAAIDELDTDTFDRTVAVNIRGVFLSCRAVWPSMRAQGSGVIVNISSIASIDPFPGFAAYGASKAWVNLWTKSLAEEGRDGGIRVFAVAPGAVETKMLRDAFPDFPPERTLDPMDVAHVVLALAQPSCRYVTGQCIVIKK